MFEICYVLSGGSCIFSVLTMLAGDLLFYGITLYTCALYDELVFELETIGEIKPNTLLAKRRYQKLRKCVQFHVDILK